MLDVRDLSISFGGHAASSSNVISDASYHARAAANGVGISYGGVQRYSVSRVRAESRAVRFGDSHADAVKIVIRP